jgi:hypothetical protein
MSWLSRHRIPLALYVVGLLGFGAASGSRLLQQSSDPHFVLLADAWLHGTLRIEPDKKKGDDWATVETVLLDDGREVRGRRLRTRPTFHIAGEGEMPIGRVKRSLGKTYYVSFPPSPALLMLPLAAIWGHRANDVVPTVLVAALALPLMFLVLRRLAAAGVSQRSPAEDVWLSLALGFGTVFFFSAVQGRVWFTAHVVGVVLCLGYVLCAIEARRPVWAGVLLGLATLARTPMAFLFPLLALEAWRVHGGRAGLRSVMRAWILFAVPVVAIAVAAMVYNAARFAEPGAFGHTYLDVRQQSQMESLGMFDLHYLSRNLAVALALLPDMLGAPPYVSISGHGLAMWFTSPFLLLVLWPRQTGAVHRALCVTAGLVVLPSLLYQNSGWFQFGYRFSLDYMVLLVVLLGVGGRPLGRGFKALVVVAIAINLFGAMTFGRDYRYYRVDQAAYQTVIAH